MTDFTIPHKATDFVTLSPFLLPQMSYSFHHVATALTEKKKAKECSSMPKTLEPLGGKLMQWIYS